MGWSRRRGAAGLVVGLLVSILLLAQGSPSSAQVVAPAPTPFDAQVAITQLSTSAIVRLPDSPALFDEARIGRLLQGTTIKILLTPFDGVEKARRDAYNRQVAVVTDWADQHSVQLILITGLSLHLESEGLIATPSNLAELRPVLQDSDLTDQILFSLGELTKSRPGGPVATQPVAPTITPRPATGADVASITQRLAAAGTVVLGGAPLTDDPQANWHNVIPGQSLKLVVQAPLDGGSPVDLAAALAPRFPTDVVVVIQGRWIDIAGPDQSLLESAVLYAYGTGLSAFLEWGATPDQLLNLVISRIALLRTGSVTGQVTPVTPDPVSSIRSWLIWIFLATVLVIASILALARRRRRWGVKALDTRLARNRDRIAARLPEIAAGVLALDGLAGSGKPRAFLDLAVERYDVARSIISRRGDGEVAAQAVDSAMIALRSAAELLHIPLPALSATTGEQAG